MNDLNFARFDAKLEQRLAESGARVDRQLAEAAATVDRKFAEVDRQFSELRSDIRALESNLRLALQKGLREQMRFFFLAWAALLAAIIALRVR